MSEDSRKLFVGGLSDSVTEGALRSVFEQAGFSVRHLAIPRDRETGRVRGFAFVTLASEEEVQGALRTLSGADCEGRPLSMREFTQQGPARDSRAPGAGPRAGGDGGRYGSGPGAGASGVGVAQGSTGPGARPSGPPRGGRDDDSTVFLGRLPFEATQEDVARLFEERGAGPIVRVTLPLGPDGRPRGFGFAALGSADAATEAVAKVNGATLLGRQIVVSPAQARGTRPPGPSGPANGAPRGPGGYGGGVGGGPSSYGRDAAPRRGYGEPEGEFFGGSPPPSTLDDEGRRRARGGEGKKRAVTPDKKKASARDAGKGPRGGGRSWHQWESDDD